MAGRFWNRIRTRAARPATLTPAQALQENGFAVFRGLFTAQECRDLAARMKAEARVPDGGQLACEDAVNRFPACRDLLFEGRILDAVRTCIGPDVRFLQVSDLQYGRDAANWHRDSVHRAADASSAPDWSPGAGPFGVVKAILYLETDNAAMGVMPGSHLSPIAIDQGHVTAVEQSGGQLIVDASTDPNRRLTHAQKRNPLVWTSGVGDVLVFDERLYHCGRRVDGGAVNARRDAPKFTVSLVFGADNAHSDRFHSYFRYARRDLHYAELEPDLQAALAARGLAPSAGWGNYYERHPDDLRLAALRRPEQLEDLIREFSAAGQRRRD